MAKKRVTPVPGNLYEPMVEAARALFNPESCVALLALYDNDTGQFHVFSTIIQEEMPSFIRSIYETVTEGEYET